MDSLLRFIGDYDNEHASKMDSVWWRRCIWPLADLPSSHPSSSLSMIPLSPGSLCPRCRRIIPPEGSSRPISTPLTDPIDLRALELLQSCTLESKGLPLSVRTTLISEFGASEDLLLRTTHRIQNYLTFKAHEEYVKETF